MTLLDLVTVFRRPKVSLNRDCTVRHYLKHEKVLLTLTDKMVQGYALLFTSFRKKTQIQFSKQYLWM